MYYLYFFFNEMKYLSQLIIDLTYSSTVVAILDFFVSHLKKLAVAVVERGPLWRGGRDV